MNVQEELIAAQARNNALLQNLLLQNSERDSRWFGELQAIRLEVASQVQKTREVQKILDTYKTTGATILTVVGLAGSVAGAFLALKASGFISAMMKWLQQ